MRLRLRPDRLQRLLAERSPDQNLWAVRLGMSRGHLAALLSGTHPYPSVRTRERLLAALQVPAEELFAVEHGQGVPEHAVQQALQDRYILDREIGQGGMGTVYLARDLRNGRTVAIKVVNTEAISEVGGATMLREIVNTNRLQHPNVLPVFESGEAGSAPYYVMPYVRSGSLREVLKRDERIPIGRSLLLLSGMAAGLDHAHVNGVLHCDVKPENILLYDDHAWLIDFGIARVVRPRIWGGDETTRLDPGAGTPAYVSPEQATGETDLTGRTDVYSLGCVMFEMLTGRPPFEGTTTLAVVSQRFAGEPPAARDISPHLPQELSDAVRRAMAVDPAQRTATPGALLRECRLAVAQAGSVLGVPTHLRLAPEKPTMLERLRDAWRWIGS